MMNNYTNGYNLPYNGQYTPQPAPAYGPSVGAVNIQIYNPTAGNIPVNSGFYQGAPYTYPCNYNNLSFQPPMIQAAPQPAAYPQVASTPNNFQQGQPPIPANAPNLQYNGAQNSQNIASNSSTEEKKDSEKTKNKQKVTLTDDYVRTLENYLNSQDKKIRLLGAKELFERFKEDETRKSDAALTALLNKTLQDPSEAVKFVGLTALDAGYATGNNETAQIVNAMQSSNSSYGEDALLASKVLLKMSGYQANAQANSQAQYQTQSNMNAIPNDPNDTLLKNNQAV